MSINSPFAYTQNPGAVPPGSITNNELADMAALTVKGNATNSTDTPQDIAAASNSTFFGRVSDALGFFTVAGSQVSNVPAGNIAATDTQAAINELDTEKAGLALANVFTASQTISDANGSNTVSSVGFDVATTSPTSVAIARYISAAGGSPNFNFRKSRGTISVPVAVQNLDQCGSVNFQGMDGTTFRTLSQIQGRIIETTPGPTAMGGALVMLPTPVGSITPTILGVLDHTNGFQIGGSLSASNTVIDPNRLVYRRTYTFGTLPAAGTAGRMAAISDGAAAPVWGAAAAGGGATYTPVIDNGAAWING